MTNWTDTATPTTVFLGNRFAPWKIFCTALSEDADERAETEAEEDDGDAGFDAEDPRDLRVRERLARLEAFSAA